MTKRRKASNWVDRDEPLEGKLARVLSYHFGRDPADAELADWASVIRGVVEADASEVHLASYLGSLPGALEGLGSSRHLLAVALWHIAKAGLVRDAAARRVEELLPHQPPQEPLGQFLERALRNAPDRAQYQPPPGTPKPKRP
jgi:hypothetical protein